MSSFSLAQLRRRKARLARRSLRLELLENRLALASTVFAGGVLTVDLDNVDEAATLTSDGTNITLTSNNAITGAGSSFATADVTKLVLTDAGNNAGQSIDFAGAVAYSLSGGLDSTGVETNTFTAAVTATGSASLSATAPQSIVVNANLTGGTGGTTLLALGAAALHTVGVAVQSGAIVTTTGSGSVTVTGTGGGGFGFNNDGVLVSGSSQITSGGAGSVTVTGNGGSGTIILHSGVVVTGAGSAITSGGGNVSVTGQGGGGGSGSDNYGVWVDSSGQVTSGGTGTVTVTGTGGSGSGHNNRGVIVRSSDAKITSGGTGTVTVMGTGGAGSGSNNYGVQVDEGQITSGGADVSVTGQGGGSAGSGGSHIGVVVEKGLIQVASGGTGTVTVTGTGGSGAGGSGGENFGVRVDEGQIKSAGGNVSVTGQGGDGGSSGGENYGVFVTFFGAVTSGGDGTVTVTGAGGTGGGSVNAGVVVDGFAQVTSGGAGTVTVMGTGGSGSGSFNFGVWVDSSGQVTSGGAGAVTVSGTGGSGSGGSNIGVRVDGSGSKITSGGGNVSVTGIGTANSEAVRINGSTITSGSSAPITLTADSINILGGGTINSGTGTTTIQPQTAGRQIDLGSTSDAASNTLELSDAELDFVTAGILRIGSPTAGNIKITAAITLGANVPELSLITGSTDANPLVSSTTGAITQSAALSVAGLAVQAVGGIQLTNAGNDVDTIAAGITGSVATSNNFRFVDTDDLTVGSVDGVSGITTSGSQFLELTTGGALTLTNGIAGDFIGLNAGGAVTQGAGAGAAINTNAAGTTAHALELIGTGVYTLTNTSNSTNGIAARPSNGVSYTNAGNLRTATFTYLDGFGGGTVGGVVTSGDITLATVNGNLTATATNGPDFSAGNAKVSLTAGGADNTIEIQANVFVAGFGGITFTADNISISGMVTAGTSTVLLQPFQTGTQIDLGSATDVAANTLELSDAELDFVTAGILRIGSATAGTIKITSAITLDASVPELSLISGSTDANPDVTSTTGAITQTASLSVAGLAVQSVGGVQLTNAGNNIDTIAGNLTGTAGSFTNNFHFVNSPVGALTVGAVDGVDGISVAGLHFLEITTTGALTLAKGLASYGIGLSAGGAVTQGSGVDAAVGATGLLLLGTGPYTLDNVNNFTSLFAASVTNGVSYTNAGALGIEESNYADGFGGTVNGITTTNGSISIKTMDGNLTVTNDININAGTAAAGDLTLQGEDGVSLPDSATATASGAITIIGGTLGTDADGSTSSLLGTLTGTTVTVQGGAGDDSFTVNPGATAIDILGGTPLPAASPGDSLTVNLAGTANPALVGVVIDADGVKGSYTFSNRANVNFQQIESVAPQFPAAITGTATGTVTEDGTLTAGDMLSVTDPDPFQNAFQAVALGMLIRTYGTFTFNEDTGAWTYTLDNAAAIVQALKSGEAVSDTLTVTTLDGSDTQDIVVSITGINDAPLLDDSLSPNLTTIDEDETDPAGTLVSELLAGAVTDSDVGAVKGIAVTAASTFRGAWEYSLDSGATWTSMGAPSPAAALLLPDTARVLFLPQPDFNGTVKLWYHAWDQSEGTAGGTLPANGQPNTASVGLEVESAALAVTPVNDAPVLDTALNPTLRTISEDAQDPAQTPVGELIAGAVTDVDENAQEGIAVTGASSFSGNWEYSLDAGATWTSMGTPSPAAALLLPASARVRFLPEADFNGSVKLWYHAWDQTEGVPGGTLPANGQPNTASVGTQVENANLTVLAVNDAPTITVGGPVGYVHDAPPIPLAPSATVDDIDSDNFDTGRLRVHITDGASAANRVQIGAGFTIDDNENVLQGATIIGTRVSKGFGTSDLVVRFNANATPFRVQQLVRALIFKTVGGSAGERKLVINVKDGDGGLSADVTKTVNVS